MESDDFKSYVQSLEHGQLERMYRQIHREAGIGDPRRQGLFDLRQELGRRFQRVYEGRDTAAVVEEIVSIYSDAGWVVSDPVGRVLVDELVGLMIDRLDLNRRSVIIAQDIAAHNLEVGESNRRYITRLLREYMGETS